MSEIVTGNYPNLYNPNTGKKIGHIGVDGRSYIDQVPKRSTKLTRKFFGATVSTTTALANTECVKIALESDFDAVQIGFLSALATVSTWKAVVAVTETALTDTQQNLFIPMAGGVAKNTLDASTETGGWRSVTFGGAATGDTPAGGTVALPTALFSDWIPLSSIPRNDGGTLPLLMVRAYCNGAVTPYSFVAGVSGQYMLMANANSQNKGRIVQYNSVTGDGVGTLATMPAALSHSFSPLLVINYRSRKTGKTIAFIGDSITENNALVTDTKFTSWGYRACALASDAAGVPAEFMNYGYSSQTQTTFLAYFKQMLTNTVKPDIAFFAGFSPNDPNRDVQRSYDDEWARIIDFVDTCKANSITPVLTTGCPNSGYNATVDGLRKLHNQKIKSFCNENEIALCDFANAGMGDNASPENWLPVYEFDATHPNELAIDTVMAPLAASVINNLL